MSIKTTVWLFACFGVEFHFFNEPGSYVVFLIIETRNVWVKVKAFPRYWLPSERKYMDNWGGNRFRKWFFTHE